MTELANSLLKVPYTKYISWIFMNWKNALCLLKAIRTSATRGKCFFPSFRNSERVTWKEFLLQTLLAAVARPKTARWATRSVLAGAVAPGHWRDPTARRRNAWRDGVMAWSVEGLIVDSWIHSDIKGHHTSQIIYVHLQNLVSHLFCIFLQMDITWYDLNLAFWQCRSSLGVIRLIESLQTVHATLLAHLHVPCSKLDWHQNPRISFPEFSSLERMCACVAQFSTDPFSLWCANGTWQQHVVSYGLTTRESTGWPQWASAGLG